MPIWTTDAQRLEDTYCIQTPASRPQIVIMITQLSLNVAFITESISQYSLFQDTFLSGDFEVTPRDSQLKTTLLYSTSGLLR